MKPVVRCDICQDRKTPKDKLPCVQCSCNKMFVSHFKEDPIVGLLRDSWEVHNDVLVNSDPEGETAWTTTKS